MKRRRQTLEELRRRTLNRKSRSRYNKKHPDWHKQYVADKRILERDRYQNLSPEDKLKRKRRIAEMQRQRRKEKKEDKYVDKRKRVDINQMIWRCRKCRRKFLGFSKCYHHVKEKHKYEGFGVQPGDIYNYKKMKREYERSLCVKLTN